MNADQRRKSFWAAFVVGAVLSSAIMMVGEILLISEYHVPRYIAAPLVQAVGVTAAWITWYQLYFRHIEETREHRAVSKPLMAFGIALAIAAIRIVLRVG